MAALRDLDRDALGDFLDEQTTLYEELKAHGLKLDLTRGKPASEQLDLSSALLSQPVGTKAADGTDVRNYGGLQGLPEVRAIFAELLNVPLDNIIAADNSSLSLMHDVMAFAMLFGLPGGQPWAGQTIKFICPVPGYDRHFSITAGFGVEMVTVPLTEHGPDLDAVRALAADPSVKGMWAVPMYANPNGVTYDEATLRALLEMDAADDFRIWYDNAYALHHLGHDEPRPVDIISLAAESGHPDRVFAFASTSKVTLAGGGVSFLASSKANLDWYLGHLSRRTIGPDKVNHLRHAHFLKDANGVRGLMRRHRDLIAPKFAIVRDTLQRRLGEYDVARWSAPRGGYFVTLEVDGTASRVVQLAKEAGIALTPAGSSHPLGNDPDDRWIRLAPTFPSQGELACAMDGVATCVLLAAAEKLVRERGQG
ncbi:aminotransferase class I/II-fold pyridoxal phosphate-dependent enzyme [Aestuariimicrobium ganziense]|uniref:aminotransferase class I/II-fold pyridoxal phosphate-dependent enzyme n=1 Tax=Aestuariimicrobium ganziense TaxID=2773677 RepID=UPI00194266D3|nr:aminotransferase class I/II-fold pyridoxal phosphate-dependent enzyme [Aestuariimicrobium ganziense]